MKSKSQQQRNAIQSDQLRPIEDEHINEEEKQQLKGSDEAEREENPGRQSDIPAPKSVRDGKRGSAR